MIKKFILGAVIAMAIVVVGGGSLLPVVTHLAHAQVTTTWSVASTTALGQNAETQAAGNAFNMIWIITAITLGLAAFFFALRWLWHRIAGRH